MSSLVISIGYNSVKKKEFFFLSHSPIFIHKYYFRLIAVCLCVSVCLCLFFVHLN